MELKILNDEEIGDLLSVEMKKEPDDYYKYPCSDGSSVLTIDCRSVAKAQAKLTVKQIVNWGNEPCDKHNFVPWPTVAGGGTVERVKVPKRRRCPKCWRELAE